MIGDDILIKLGEKLIKVSDSIFQEAEPPEDRNRPLEWQRNFNIINLPLKNLKIITHCSVHDTEFDWEEEKSVNPIKLVKPKISDTIAITGELDEHKVRDQIYFAVMKEEGTFSVERSMGTSRITLRAGSPSEGNEKMPAGLYSGSAFRSNFHPSEDDLCFDLYLPKPQVLSLIAAIRADENATTEVGAYLLSFTYEVDDFFREHYHSRDLIINDSALCFVSWVEVRSKIGSHYIPSESDASESNEADSYNEEQVTLEQRSHRELLAVLLSYSKPLNKLVTALWTLIAAVVLYVFFAQH
jgi:hypothetical protein